MSICAGMDAEWITGEDFDGISMVMASLQFGVRCFPTCFESYNIYCVNNAACRSQTVWTDAEINGTVYMFGNGIAVMNKKEALDVQRGRPFVTFSRKNSIYQRKKANRRFSALCRKGQTDNCKA